VTRLRDEQLMKHGLIRGRGKIAVLPKMCRTALRPT